MKKRIFLILAVSVYLIVMLSGCKSEKKSNESYQSEFEVDGIYDDYGDYYNDGEKTLEDIGFEDLQGHLIWVAIEEYDFSEGFVKLSGQRSHRHKDLYFDENYLKYGLYDGQNGFKEGYRWLYSILDNDTMHYGKSSTVFIIERVVGDEEKNWIVLKTKLEGDSAEKWYVPAEIIEWEGEPEVMEEHEHDIYWGYKYYLK